MISSSSSLWTPYHEVLQQRAICRADAFCFSDLPGFDNAAPRCLVNQHGHGPPVMPTA
jgi:hypothetical protein